MEAKSSSSNGREEEIAIFTDTNMSTHIVVPVSPLFTTSDFQKELERHHLSCFPKLGELKVCKVMVKRRSCFYSLPKSLLIKHAFVGLQKPWFLHVELSPLTRLENQIGNFSENQIGSPPQFAFGTPAKNVQTLKRKNVSERRSGNEDGMKSKVGKRIISAAYKLRVSRNMQRPSANVFRWCLNASPGIASTVFEMSDSDSDD